MLIERVATANLGGREFVDVFEAFASRVESLIDTFEQAGAYDADARGLPADSHAAARALRG